MLKLQLSNAKYIKNTKIDKNQHKVRNTYICVWWYGCVPVVVFLFVFLSIGV